jgi:excisionase family DNA binding protein
MNAPIPFDRSQDSDEVLDYRAAAAYLHVSPRTLERWTMERRIPFVRLPRRGSWSGVRFLKADLDAWLKRQTVKPRKEAA